MKNRLSEILIFFAVLIIFGLGVSFGYYFGFSYEQKVLNEKMASIKPIRDANSGYKLVDPLLAYIIPSSDQNKQMANLKNKISQSIDSSKKNNKLSDASVFFYDLNKGRWIGVNEKEEYNPASMLKVVIMVSYFKEAEKDSDILNNYLIYTSDIDNFIKQDRFNSLSNLVVGHSYKTDDLISKMIIDSDNGAEYLLLANIKQSSLDYIYNTLNIKNPNGKNDFTISPRTYSLFLRILYSSTYLNEDDSEKALEILSKTTFTDGLVSGVPSDTVVSHKYGEHIISQNNIIKEVELHDCGIVYYPKNPYLLCVMTKGIDLDGLKVTIKNISSLIYKDYSETQY
jgi:beta-lactamase class A